MLAALAIAAAMLNPHVTQANVQTTICRTGYTATVRPPTSYTRRWERQHLKPGQSATLYVVDHSIPLELGGAPRAANLRLQTRPEAKRKDVLENRLHRAVCKGTVSLPVAQAEMLRRWP